MPGLGGGGGGLSQSWQCQDFGSSSNSNPSLIESTFLEDDISHSRWTSRLGMIKIMNADIIEVKNNESLMQCYHLMVVVNKM